MTAKTLLFKGLALTALLALALASMENLARHLPSVYLSKAKGLETSLPHVQILVTGASQANQGIDPSVLGLPAYNLACVGQDAYYDTEIVLAAAEKAPSLKLVLIPISYISFEYHFKDTPEFWRTFSYSLYFGVANEFSEYKYDIRNYSALALTTPLDTLRRWRKGGDSSAGVDKNGFEAIDALDEDIIDYKINDLTGRKRVRYHHSIMNQKIHQTNAKHYRRLLDGLSKRGIRAAFVIFPVDASYSAWVNPTALKKRDASLKKLSSEFDAPVFDFFKDASFTTEDFADVDHLNVLGAKKLSLKIRTLIVQPLLKPSSS